jgi:hypothetical protein
VTFSAEEAASAAFRHQMRQPVEILVVADTSADIAAVADSQAADRAATVDMAVAGLVPADSPVAGMVATVDIVAVVDIQAADRAAARPDIVDIPVALADWDQMVDTEDNSYKLYFAPDVLSIEFVYDRLFMPIRIMQKTYSTPIIRHFAWRSACLSAQASSYHINAIRPMMRMTT